MLDDTSPQKKKSSFSAEELDDDELDWKQVCKLIFFVSETSIFVPMVPVTG